MYLRILYKIRVFGFISQHLCISRVLCKIHISGFIFQHLYISGSSARSMSPDPCVRFMSKHPPISILCKIHVSGFMIFLSQDSLQDPCLRVHVSASTNMDPLQDPHLRIHVSASLYLRLLCKIHVSGCKHPYVSQVPLQDPCLRIHVSASICISGTSAGSMSPDPYISIHMYLRILCKIHVSDSCRSIFISQGPLQDPCLRIHGSCRRAHFSASLYLRILCKIHVFGFMSQHLYISGSSARSMCPIHVVASTKMDPLQDPHLRIHVSASLYLMDSLQDPCLRIHVAASIFISRSSARSMSPDSCLSIFVSQDPLQDPCLRIRDPLERFAQAKRKF